MSKPEKVAKSGFIIKLSNETVQKLSEEEQLKQNKEANENKKTSIEDQKGHQHEKNETLPKEHKSSSEKSSNSKNIKSSSIVSTSVASSDKDLSPNKPSINEKTNEDRSKDSSWGDYAPYITYEGEEAIYTDPTTQQRYTWNKETNSWDGKTSSDVPGRVYSFEDDTHVYTDPDGSKCFWDEHKKAWIPKVDDDFLAVYQMSYGFVDNTAKEEKSAEAEKPKKKPEPAASKRKNEAQWFDQSQENNTKVYVSNLPLDTTEEEFVDFMQKCGLVERDPQTRKMKVKLYMDKELNCFKGDALCSYIKIESVDLALKLLDGMDLKGNKVKVERAQFQLKGEYNPALKPKKKRKKELEKIKKMQQKLFDWRPEKFIGEKGKHERVVIVKNLFHPSDFDQEVQLILDYQQDLREECTKSGEVRKVVIYDRHPEGVAQITMKEPEQADAVVQLINGRWFGKRQITAEIWDGRTKYRIAETDADISKRIDKWDKFLEDKEGDKSTKTEDKKDDITTSEQKDSKPEIKAKEEQNMDVANENIEVTQG